MDMVTTAVFLAMIFRSQKRELCPAYVRIETATLI